MNPFKESYTSRGGEKHKTDRWYFRFRDHLRRLHKVAAFKSLRATRELQRRIDELVDCKASKLSVSHELSQWLQGLDDGRRQQFLDWGLLDPKRAAATKPLLVHVEDWRLSILAKGKTKKHADRQAQRVRAVFDGCTFKHWTDVASEIVQAHLWDVHDNGHGIGRRTLNHYIGAVKQFGKWMVRAGRANSYVLDSLTKVNAAVDRRRIRRALAPAEQAALVTRSAAESKRFGMTGPERSLVYRLALETGLRASELRSLTRASFDLTDEHPTVSLQARDEKAKRGDRLPLRATTVALLEAHLARKLPMASAFNMPHSYDTAAMIRSDLEAAGIEYEDPSGRVADFHALRHTLGTNLARAGVHPKTAQRLMRHSTITLTMDLYTIAAMEQVTDAVDKLPDLFESEDASMAPGGVRA